MPYITVIVPVYKVENFLKRCVESIRSQTFGDFDLVLVDDGSPDRCGQICDAYAESDQRIHVVHQNNGGLSLARNAGIDWAFANSSSEFICFIDSDDWVHPRFLEFLLNAVKETGALISSCEFAEVSGETDVKYPCSGAYELTGPEDIYTRGGKCLLSFACGKIYKKSLWKDIRFPAGKLYEDTATTYRVLFQTDKAAKLNSVLYYYYVNPDGLSRRPWSLRNLDYTDALETVMKDTVVMSHSLAAHFVIRAYILGLAWNVESLQKNSRTAAMPEKKAFLKIYGRQKRKLRLFFFRYHEASMFSEEQKKYIRDMAFPGLAWCRWTAHGIIRKLKKMAGQESG